jgi:hypothetical protein
VGAAAGSVWHTGIDAVTQRRYAKLSATTDAVIQRGKDRGELRHDVTPADAHTTLERLLVEGALMAATGQAPAADANAMAVRELSAALAPEDHDAPDPDSAA